MTRVNQVVQRYAAVRAVADRGISIFAVGDPAGARLNRAVRRSIFVLGDDRSAIWDDLLQAASALRWRRMSQPQPNAHQPAQAELVAEVVHQANRLRNLVGNESLLDEIAAAATAVGQVDSPVGDALLEAIGEVGAENCVVVASKGSARAGMERWLQEHRVVVVVASELNDFPDEIEQTYVLSPPVLMPASVVTAPLTPETTFVIPSWFGNRSVPGSILGEHAEGRIVVRARVYPIGDITEPTDPVPDDAEIEDAYLPQPVWGERTSGTRQPGADEVEARKILLSGGLALWLDDGDRIRSLHPRHPAGDRVGYEAVADVVPGIYLMLREGETERGVMYEQALVALGARADGIRSSQARWKRALEDRLNRMGTWRAAEELRNAGVRSPGQVRAWTDPRLICPQRDTDFTLLLEWLGEPSQPAFGNAITLRRAIYKASADLRRELEAAVDQADLVALERDGVLHLDVQRPGFRGMTVARVLARAPFTEIVNRRNVRVPSADGSSQWLD